MQNFMNIVDDKLVELFGKMQENACETFSITPPQFRAKLSTATLALASISGVLGVFYLYRSPDFNTWIVPYTLWLLITLGGLFTVVSMAPSSAYWSAAEHRKLLLGAVLTRANGANIRFVMAFVTALTFAIVIAGVVIGAGHGTFFFSMVALYFLNHSMRGYLAATVVPPLQGRFRNDTGY